jgi:undecaprenyl-diphosphatase
MTRNAYAICITASPTIEKVSGLLSIPEAILLGIVEGITEFLPISSTGHLLVVQQLLGFDTAQAESAADTYAIAIQFGAILAVAFLYRQRIRQMLRGVVGQSDDGRTLLLRLITAFLPAAFLGAVFGDAIKDQLFGPIPVIIAWAVGGVLLIVWTPQPRGSGLMELSVQSAFIIGLAQAIALWPGVSRALVTLVAALLVGLSMSAALEFSFLLGLATLTAASIFDVIRNGDELFDQFGYLAPAAGLVAAFVTAIVAVKWVVGYLATHDLRIFGWYRLAIAAIGVVLLLTGTL